MPIPLLVAGGIAAGKFISDMYATDQENKSRKEGRAALTRMKGATDTDYAKMMGDIESYYDQRGSLGTEQDANAYTAAIRGYDPNDFVYNRKPFEYNKTAADFRNPYYDQIIGDTASTVQHTAAGAGLGRGSGAATAIADAVAKKNDELNKTAMEQFRDDRNFEYQKYSDYANAMQDALAQKRAATESKIALQGNLAQDYYGVMDSRQADLLKARQDRMSANQQYDMAMAGLY